MEKTTLYLPAVLQRGLREVARRSGRSQAAVVREALDEYLQRQDPPRFHSIGAADHGSLDARDTEAVLDREWDQRWSR